MHEENQHWRIYEDADHKYHWVDGHGNSHGPYHNYRSAENGMIRWREADLD